MKKISLKIPSDWRIGQTIFNFLEFLQTKGFKTEYRMCDPFHIQDDEFIQYWNEAYDLFMGVRPTKK